jgi:membrane protein YdbS with pleckstrin-like domain
MRLVRLRGHARRLTWSALVLIAAATAVGYFTGNPPAPLASWWRDWMLWAAAGAVVLLLVVVPYLRWLSHTYTITTRRVIEQSGLFGRRRSELAHARGYTISEKRGPLQRLWGAGTLVLSNGVETPLRLRNVPSVRLVHETLADQVEISQILAHRDAPLGSPRDGFDGE